MKKRSIYLFSLYVFIITVFPLSSLAVSLHTTHQSDVDHKYYGWQLCNYPEFSCIPVKSGMNWRSLWTDPWQREMIERLNRINMSMDSRPWIVVPKQLTSLTYKQLSPFPSYRETHGNRLVLVNLSLQAFAAYDEHGNLIHWGPASGGRGFCDDVHRACTTPTGSYAVERKEGPECISNKYPVDTGGGAHMPYCMFFHGGFGLHGSDELPGYNDSHGCVRLYVDDARWLNLYFVQIGTPVVITH